MEVVLPSSGKASSDVDKILRSVEGPLQSISFQCPFQFLGCLMEFHHSRKQEWVEHSLTHFFRVQEGRRGTCLVRVEPPNSCLCPFCDTHFSNPSGAACWRDYLDHVCDHRLHGHELARIDWELLEYLWENHLVTSADYRELKPLKNIIEPPGLNSDEDPAVYSALNSLPYRRKKLVEPPGLDSDEDLGLRVAKPWASKVSETPGSGKQVSTSETHLNTPIRRASVGMSAKQEQWRHRICRKIIVSMLWIREQDLCLPTEIWSSPASFKFSDVLQISSLDKIKGLFETYSGREWDWWPFDPPAKPLESGKVRIRWQCVGELNSIMPCTGANGLRPVAINAGSMHRGTLPGSVKPWLMRT